MWLALQQIPGKFPRNNTACCRPAWYGLRSRYTGFWFVPSCFGQTKTTIKVWFSAFSYHLTLWAKTVGHLSDWCNKGKISLFQEIRTKFALAYSLFSWVSQTHTSVIGLSVELLLTAASEDLRGDGRFSWRLRLAQHSNENMLMSRRLTSCW